MSEIIQTDVPNGENLRAAYQALCSSYNAIDTFRGQLLGFLPLASGGIFVLLTNNPNSSLSLSIGLFGFFITLGLYIFEIYGTRRCTHLIILGRHLEEQMQIEGQFSHRPRGLQDLSKEQQYLIQKRFRLRALINEPMAAGIIYPTVGAAWLYLALQGKPMLMAFLLPGIVFGLGIVASFTFNHWLNCSDGPEKRTQLSQG